MAEPIGINAWLRAIYYRSGGIDVSDPTKPLFIGSFVGVAATVAQDLFEYVAPAAGAKIWGFGVFQYTDFGDAAAEILSIVSRRGYTASGSGGTTPTPVDLSRSGAVAGGTLEANNTTQASGGSPVVTSVGTFNVAAGYEWIPPQRQPIVLGASERFTVSMTVPADSLTLNGYILVQEL